MLEALALANGAYAIIKQTIQNGRELSSAGSAIAKFVSAEDQLQQDLHKKDYIAYCSESRKKRKEALIARKKKKEQMQELALKIILGILVAGLLAGVVTVLAIIAKKKGII